MGHRWEIWTIGETFEMSCFKRKLKIKWADRIKSSIGFEKREFVEGSEEEKSSNKGHIFLGRRFSERYFGE